MKRQEIDLLTEQINSLARKDFNLEAWKAHTIIILERIFGSESSKTEMVKDLKYDFSSWSLRDTSASGKEQSDPVKQLAKEILKAAIDELKLSGTPTITGKENEVWDILENELTGKEIKELKSLAKKSDTEKIKLFLQHLGQEKTTTILTVLLAKK